MKSSLFLLFLYGFLIPKVHSQNAVVGAGGNATGNGGKVSYSIGQSTYTFASGTNGFVSQGIQQPFEISTLGNDNFPNIVLEMSVFPNPTIGNVTLKIAILDSEVTSYQLFDVTGKHIISEQISKTTTEINMNNLNAAIYFLNVTNQNATIKTFKIIKN